MNHTLFTDLYGSSINNPIILPYRLFLDDIRMPEDVVSAKLIDELFHIEYLEKSWIICRSYYEFTQCITTYGIPSHISFDHDLGDITYNRERTGYDAALWLLGYILNMNDKGGIYISTYIHSANIIGRRYIASTLCDIDTIITKNIRN